MANTKKTEVWKETKKLREEAGDEPDSNKKFRESEHHGRDDARENGELPEREENKSKGKKDKETDNDRDPEPEDNDTEPEDDEGDTESDDNNMEPHDDPEPGKD